jgi:hypothetical protein
MTEVAGTIKQVGQGLTQKTYKYDALGSLVDIVTNAAGMLINLRCFESILTSFTGQVVQAVVQKPSGGGGGSGGGASSTVRPSSASATPMPVTLPSRSRATSAP